MALIRKLSERLARKTSRRGLLGRGTDLAFGALIGVAAGAVTRPDSATAAPGTVCFFPANRPCACEHCQANGTCAKPCVFYTIGYANGCWVTDSVTCCDCTCGDLPDAHCGCGTDLHGEHC
jgi:hypothetical protein